MLHRTLVLALGRIVIIAAGVSAAGIVNCATYPGSRSITLDGTVSPTIARAKRVSLPATLVEVMSGARGTYIDRLLADRDSIIERWPDYVDRPLAVWIDSSATLSGPQAAFPAAVRLAFAQWGSTGIPLEFAFVASPRDADIRVRWTDHLDHKTGSTTWRTGRNGGWLSSADITLATHISDGQILDARGMRAIALHEVGHALGLAHSTNPLDVMASLVHVDALSAADHNTIKLLYSLPAGRVR